MTPARDARDIFMIPPGYIVTQALLPCYKPTGTAQVDIGAKP